MGVAIDVLLLLGLAATVAFPIAARVAARAEGLPPPSSTPPLPPLRRTPTAPLRTVPALEPGGAAAGAVADGRLLTDTGAMDAALNQADSALFGPIDLQPMVHLVTDGNFLLNESESPGQIDEARIHYPFRYPPLDRFLDSVLPSRLDPRRAAAANDLAGLLILAATRFPNQFPNGAAAAFDLLNRARAGGSCLPQLNLALLLSTDQNSRDDDTAKEFQRAAADCPGDPTPLYLLGEYQSVRALGKGNDSPGQPLSEPERIRRALATFHLLEREFPGSPAGWSGEADTDLRLGYLTDVPEPFTARNYFRRAVPLYRRAQDLSTDPGLTSGAARAAAGLHLDGQAVSLQTRAEAGDTRSMALQVRLVDYLERARRFAQAASTNARFLAGTSVLPNGRSLIASPPVGVGGENEEVFLEDAEGPVSLGAATMDAVSLAVGPGPGGAGAGVLDISFIPTFRQIDGITGQNRWCREWSWRRDLVLAGRASEALRGFPSTFTDPRSGQPCEGADAASMLAGVAELEAGDPPAAVARVRSLTFDLQPYHGDPQPELALLGDARQDMWRYAGDLSRARSAVRDWLRADPSDPLALDREGEIAYLGGRFAGAATLFARADHVARTPLQSGDERLKEGTSLEMNRETDAALRVLASAARLAERVRVPAAKAFDDQTAGQAAYDEYNAQVQSGDTELRAHRFEAALPHYDAARRVEKLLPPVAGERLIRPEVLENNEALDLIEVGKPGEALSLADAAVRTDPADPVFLQNQGFALVRLGRPREGAGSYRSALDSDPTLFPAANDVGVILAKEGRWSEAAAWLRRAIGIEPGYALARFNLGIVLEHLGPGHVLESEGAFGEASNLDPSLRYRNRTLAFDDDAFFTTLDLSKPLPPNWHFARSESRAPVAVAGLVLVLLALRVGRAIGSEVGGSKAQERMLELSRRRGWIGRVLEWRVGPWLAVVATLAVFLWPLIGSQGASVADYVLLAGGVAILTGVAFRARALVARRMGTGTRHVTWTPTVAVGLAAAALGFGFAPMPVVEHEEHPRLLHLVTPLLMGAMAALLLLVGHATGVPLTRALGAAALVMASSMLAPVEPLDGAYLDGWVSLAASLVLLTLAVLLALGIV